MVIHLDPWWNVSAEHQATDRAHRIGQTRKVHVLKLVCMDSIEEKVMLTAFKKYFSRWNIKRRKIYIVKKWYFRTN